MLDVAPIDTAGKERWAVRARRAYKRMFIDPATGELRADAKIILADLMRHAEFFGAQAHPHDLQKTLALAVKRDVVLHVTASIELTEAQIMKMTGAYNDD